MPKQGGKEDCEKKVKQIIKDMNCGLNPTDNDRTHCIGSKRTDDNGVVSQQIIVKFKSFRQQTQQRQGKKMTKRRLSILNEAKEFAKGVPSINFAFCDIYCNVKLKSGKFIYFDSVSGLEGSLNELTK